MIKLFKFLFAIWICIILILLCCAPVVITLLLSVFVNGLFLITSIITMPLSIGLMTMMINEQRMDWVKDWITGLFE